MKLTLVILLALIYIFVPWLAIPRCDPLKRDVTLPLIAYWLLMSYITVEGVYRNNYIMISIPPVYFILSTCQMLWMFRGEWPTKIRGRIKRWRK
jgi:hypothetical protein